MALLDDLAATARRVVAAVTGPREDGFGNSYSGLGVSSVDPTLGGTPQAVRPLTFEQRRMAMRESELMARVIEYVPNLATQRGWRVVLPADAMEDAEVARDACATFDGDHHITHRVREADRLGRMDGDGFLFVVTDDVTGEGPDIYATPLNLERVTKVLAVHVLDLDEVVPAAGCNDPAKPEFRDVEVWSVSMSAGVIGGSPGGARKVHNSRLIRIPGVPLSLRERAEGQLNSVDSRVGYNGSMMDLYRQPVADCSSLTRAAVTIGSRWELLAYRMQARGQRQVSNQGGGTKSVRDRISAIAEGLSVIGMLVMAGEDEIQRLGANGTGFDEVHQAARRSVSAVEGIPQREIFGDQPGGLGTNDENASQTRDRIANAHQTLILEPALRKLYCIALASMNYNGPFELVFEPLHVPTALEEADVEAKQAQTDAAYLQLGVVTAEEVRQSRFGDAESSVQLEDNEDDDDPLADLREDAEAFTPPEAVRRAAARALAVREDKPPSQRGMTATGLARARDLANGRAVSLSTVRRMASYFARHEVDKKGSTWGDKGPGWQAWHGWGGDAGRRWVRGILADIEE